MAISEAKKKRVWERSDHRCKYCHQPLKIETMTIDHLIPRSAFKDTCLADDEDNLCVACKTCNTAKAAMSVKEFRTWVNTRNNELLKLEAERRSAVARAEELSKQIEGKHFAYIHHLRTTIM